MQAIEKGDTATVNKRNKAFQEYFTLLEGRMEKFGDAIAEDAEKTAKADERLFASASKLLLASTLITAAVVFGAGARVAAVFSPRRPALSVPSSRCNARPSRRLVAR